MDVRGAAGNGDGMVDGKKEELKKQERSLTFRSFGKLINSFLK